MDLMSNIEKREAKVTFDAGHLQVININDYVAIQERDMVVCIPYLIEKNSILLRYENIPVFELINPAIDKYINVMSTTTEKDEPLENCLKRGLRKEFGIELKNVDINLLTPIFINKGNTARYHICILPLMEHQYEQLVPNEVEQMQMKNSNLIINISEINNLIIYDLITRYCIDLFKTHYSLF